MITAKEYSGLLIHKAILQTYSLSYEMKFNEAKEIVLNQLSVTKMFLFDACNLDNKHCRKTLDLITNIKNEIEKLNFKDYELLSSKK